MSRWFVGVALLLSIAPALVVGQDGEGLGPAPAEARAIVSRAVLAMGGARALEDVKTAVMTVVTKPGQIQECHSFKLKGRLMHYASRRSSGAGFDVVLAGGRSFLCDRNAKGKVTYVEDLSLRDAKEGSYERDIMFIPLLLTLLLEKNARMDSRGKNSVGDFVVRAQIRPPSLRTGEPFVVRLRFDRETHLLTAAMGTVPWGTDKGKKRYCVYTRYRGVRVGDRRVQLPHALEDKRGKDAKARAFSVTWKLNKTLRPELFVRPNVVKDDH